jgi:hypothetical protein
MAQNSKTGQVSCVWFSQLWQQENPELCAPDGLFYPQSTAIPRTSYSRLQVLFALA